MNLSFSYAGAYRLTVAHRSHRFPMLDRHFEFAPSKPPSQRVAIAFAHQLPSPENPVNAGGAVGRDRLGEADGPESLDV